MNFTMGGIIKGNGNIVICNCDTNTTEITTTNLKSTTRLTSEDFGATSPEAIDENRHEPLISLNDVAIYGIKSGDNTNLVFNKIMIDNFLDNFNTWSGGYKRYTQTQNYGSAIAVKNELKMYNVDFGKDSTSGGEFGFMGLRANGAVNVGGMANIDNCNFYNCRVGENCGALCLQSDDSFITNCVFKYCE
ncbi:MAG: hypothetical protein Q4E99_04305, partial [Bacillota bacterium]|nr:hypothetical protein [Bacillota bacterium]